MAKRKRRADPRQDTPGQSPPDPRSGTASEESDAGRDASSPARSSAPSGDSAWADLHLWEIQPIRDVLGLASIFGILYLGYVLRIVTVPILVAMALAYLFEPVVSAVVRRGWLTRNQVAAGIIVIAGALVVVPLVLGVGFALAQGKNLAVKTGTVVASAQVGTEFGDDGELVRTADAQEKLAQLTPRLRKVSDALVHLETEVARRQTGAANAQDSGLLEEEALTLFDIIAQWGRAQVPAIGTTAVSKSGGVLSVAYDSIRSLGAFLFAAFLTAFFFYFICTGYGRVLAFWEGLIPERKKGRVVELLGKMDRVIAGFVRGRVMVGLILSLFYTVAYAVIGVPAPLILGPMVGLLTIIPYVSLIGVPVSIALMWLEPEGALMFGDSWWYPLAAPIIVYTLGQMLDDYVLSPVIQGEATGMDVPSILFASLAGGVLAGVYGLLLAIPAAACARILLIEVFWPRFRAWSEGRERDFLPIQRGP